MEVPGGAGSLSKLVAGGVASLTVTPYVPGKEATIELEITARETNCSFV